MLGVWEGVGGGGSEKVTEKQGDKVKGGGRWRYLVWRWVKWGAWGVVGLVVWAMVWSMFEVSSWRWTVPNLRSGAGGQGSERTVVGVKVEVGRMGLDVGSDFRSVGWPSVGGKEVGWSDLQRLRETVREQDRMLTFRPSWRNWWWLWLRWDGVNTDDATKSSHWHWSVVGVKGSWTVSRVQVSSGWFSRKTEPARVVEIWRGGVSVPTVYVAIVAAGVAWIAGRRERRALGWWWVKQERCARCGYDLRGSEGVAEGQCSECGAAWKRKLATDGGEGE